MGSKPLRTGRVQDRLPQPVQFVVELGQSKTEPDKDQGIATSEVDPPPEIVDVERKESLGRDALALPQLLRVPAWPMDDRRFAHSDFSKRGDELLSNFGRERKKLGVRLLDALEAERHGPLSRAAFGYAR